MASSDAAWGDDAAWDADDTLGWGGHDASPPVADVSVGKIDASAVTVLAVLVGGYMMWRLSSYVAGTLIGPPPASPPLAPLEMLQRWYPSFSTTELQASILSKVYMCIHELLPSFNS